MRAAPSIAVGIAALSSIAFAHPVQLDKGRHLDQALSSYITFFVLDRDVSGDASVDREIRGAVEAALADRGLVETSPEESQAVVILHAATAGERTRDAFYRGWGGWQWRPDEPAAKHESDIYKPGALVVDMFDAWTKRLIWHGSVDNAVGGGAGSNGHAIRTAVTRAFRAFPHPATALADRRPFDPGPAGDREYAMRIIFAPSPAVLLRIDGEPRYEPVAGTELQRIVNTSALILRDESGMHYLRLGGSWLETYDLMGSWSASGVVPDGAAVALETLAPGRKSEPGTGKGPAGTPAVYVSTTPAELIVTDGDPDYVGVAGTRLLRLENTTATVFREPTDRQLYVRVPEGWFRAWSSAGPWEPIAEQKLPADLAAATRTGAK